jgi:hypothetical protein
MGNDHNGPDTRSDLFLLPVRDQCNPEAGDCGIVDRRHNRFPVHDRGGAGYRYRWLQSGFRHDFL